MALEGLKKCANCGKEATMKCAGCMEAPEYQPGDSVNVAYCGRGCQKSHWSTHRAYCRTMRQRKKLLRAANILKTALLTYREVLFDIDLTKIEFQASILRLYQRPTAGFKCWPFPSHLTTNTEHKEAALANNQCTTAMALLGRLTRKLLAGEAMTIEVMDLHVGKPLIRTELIPGPDSSNCPHTVLKVGRLFSGEKWIVDITGCQYGFRDVLIPYEQYLSHKECKIAAEPTTYDATETKDLDYFSTLPFMNMTRSMRKGRELEKQARLYFTVFVDTNVNKDMLGGSAADFKVAVDGFADELRSHMLDFARRKLSYN